MPRPTKCRNNSPYANYFSSPRSLNLYQLYSKSAGLLLVIATWRRYACSIDEQGKVFTVQDPMADKFIRIFREYGLDAEKLSTAFFGLTEIFGQIAQENKLLQPGICYWLEQLIKQGSAATIKVFSR